MTRQRNYAMRDPVNQRRCINRMLEKALVLFILRFITNPLIKRLCLTNPGPGTYIADRPVSNLLPHHASR